MSRPQLPHLRMSENRQLWGSCGTCRHAGRYHLTRIDKSAGMTGVEIRQCRVYWPLDPGVAVLTGQVCDRFEKRA